jgi:hypothetical protein
MENGIMGNIVEPGVTGRRMSDPGVFSRHIAGKRALWPSRVVCEFFGNIHPRSLNRWKKTLPGFPRPTTINHRDYYDPDAVEAFALQLRVVAEHEAAVADETLATSKPAVETQAEKKKNEKKARRPRRAAANTNEQKM